MNHPLVYTCTMCRKEFLLRSSLLRHRALELPKFRSEARRRRKHYEKHRRRYKARYIATYGLRDDTFAGHPPLSNVISLTPNLGPTP